MSWADVWELKRECCKTRWKKKINFMQLLYFTPVWCTSPRCVGIVRKWRNCPVCGKCTAKKWSELLQFFKFPLKFFLEPLLVLTGVVIAAGSLCWGWGGNFHRSTDTSCPGKSSDATALGNSYFGNVLIPWTFDGVSGSAREQSQAEGWGRGRTLHWIFSTEETSVMLSTKTAQQFSTKTVIEP